MRMFKTVFCSVRTGLSGLKKAFAKKKSPSDLLSDDRGEAYIGEAVKILIAVVVGALLLGLIYALIKNDVFPTIKTKLLDLFDYDGTT